MHRNTELVWTEPRGNLYRCQVLLTPDVEGGGYTAESPSLPGAVSEGDTEAAALDNIRDALSQLIRSYKDAGVAVPWGAEQVAPPAETLVRWVFVDA